MTNKFLKKYPQLWTPKIGDKVKVVGFEGKYLVALANNINGMVVTVHEIRYETLNIIVIINGVKILLYRHEYRLFK